MKVLLLALLLTGCGLEDDGPFMQKHSYDKYDVPFEFQVWVDLFVKEGEARGQKLTVKPLIVKYAPLDEKVLGQCTLYVQAEPKIEIDPVKWDNQQDCFKELLLFHELGHCILHRNHDNTIMPDKTKKSIMYFQHIGCPMYEANRDYYLDELFSKKNDMKGFGLYE